MEEHPGGSLNALFPAGLLAACHFLKFQSILPPMAIHAIGFVPPFNRVDKHLWNGEA